MNSIQRYSKRYLLAEIPYVILLFLSFYFLLLSRTGEARTAWEVLHPWFIPTLFAASFFLFTILMTDEKVAYKMLLIIPYSILLHSLFSVIFPAGDLSGQQMVLGRTRRVFDNTILHGLTGWPNQTVQIFIYEMFQGANLQAALSTIFARILGVDIFYVHLFFIPALWGIFVPIASFLTARALGGTKKASVLSSVLVSAFPYTIYFGAISVPNSLGFIFFFFSLYFMLEYLSSNDSRIKYWVIIFSFFSLLSHYLTGIVSFSLFFLVLAFKAYERDVKPPSLSVKVTVASAFLIAVTLLPVSFIYLNLLGTSTNSTFTLKNFSGIPLQEVVSLFLIGGLTYGFELETIFLNVIGPLLAFLWMIYAVYTLRRNPDNRFRTPTYFLFSAFIATLIDYRIIRLFMSGLPLNPERLWVLRDFMATPFIALAIHALLSPLKGFLKAKPSLTTVATLKALQRDTALNVSTVLIALNVIIPILLGGWVTFSLTAAYPQVATLQTTWYELEAVKYIEQNTNETYVVIGDIWTIFAGEMIVGINNPQAYYFKEIDAQGQRLFTKMLNDTSPQTMTEAMNQTGIDTDIAYFIVTEPRLGTEQFNRVISKAKETLTVFHITGDGKLYVFSYRKEQV